MSGYKPNQTTWFWHISEKGPATQEKGSALRPQNAMKNKRAFSVRCDSAGEDLFFSGAGGTLYGSRPHVLRKLSPNHEIV